MKTKMFEVRDSGTYIPVLAIEILAGDDAEKYMLNRAGYDPYCSAIVVMKIEDVEAHYDVYDWGVSRTMRETHKYIIENFDKLTSGDVIDVEFILGKTDRPKESERFYYGK